MNESKLKRDFSKESSANTVLRGYRAFSGRAKGFILAHLNVFAHPKPKGLFFRSTPKLINSKAIRFGNNVHFGLFSRIECYFSEQHNDSIKISIGDNTSFGDYFHIGSLNKIKIGENVLGGSNILVLDHNHGSPKEDMLNKNPTAPRHREITSRKSISIGNNVWIGDNVIILQGSIIEEGAIIPANSIVKSKVSAFTIFESEKT